MRNAGAGAIGGVTVEAASGIEIALWDLAGRILETPTVNLMGGRFRDRVRFYRTLQLPAQHVEDPAAWRDLVQQARAERWGWTAFKFQGDGIPRALDPQYQEPGHDPDTRRLLDGDIRQIVRLMEVVREEFGPRGEFAIDLHWRFDTRDAIDLARPSKACALCGSKIRCRRRIPTLWLSSGDSLPCLFVPEKTSIRAKVSFG